MKINKKNKIYLLTQDELVTIFNWGFLDGKFELSYCSRDEFRKQLNNINIPEILTYSRLMKIFGTWKRFKKFLREDLQS